MWYSTEQRLTPVNAVQKIYEKSYDHIDCMPCGSPIFFFNVDDETSYRNNDHGNVDKLGKFLIENVEIDNALNNPQLHEVKNNVEYVDDEVGFFRRKSETKK